MIFFIKLVEATLVEIDEELDQTGLADPVASLELHSAGEGGGKLAANRLQVKLIIVQHHL